MASAKRIQTNDITSFYLPISKHGDSALSSNKSKFYPLKRARDDLADGFVAASLVDTELHPIVHTLEAAVDSGAPFGSDLEALPALPVPSALSASPADHSDIKFSIQHVPSADVLASTAYLQMPSRDTHHRMLLQSSDVKPVLSDKDYAASLPTVSSSVVSHAPQFARSSPQFDEDDDELLDLKLQATKGFAEEFSEDALLLPKSFIELEVIFEQVLKILSTAYARGGRRGTPLDSLKDDMSRLYFRSFKTEHLKQIMALAPNCLVVGHAWKDGKFCHRTVSINTSAMNIRPDQQILHSKCLSDMKSSFRLSMISFLRARHAEFLQSRHPELKIHPERTSQWHADFDLCAVQLPVTELPALPQVQVDDSAIKLIKDVDVKITPEIERAFEQHQSETMSSEKLRHIKDCSKSAIGLQNIEKLQRYELSQFALQHSFKTADEKNAESALRLAADALRCLFRQRSKLALSLSDVLKSLHQTKGLTFKSDIDALDMVDKLVERLPSFFSKKKYPTHGEMLRLSSSDPLPWHQSRDYPQ